MKLYRYNPERRPHMQGVVGRKSYTKAASIPSTVRTRIEREPAERVRELANHREGRASDSGRLVTLVRGLNPRCNCDGKAFRERDGLRLKAGAWFTHV